MAVSPRQEVIQELRRQIISGDLPAGQRLPTEFTMATRFRVSRGTVRNALAELADLGLVEQKPGVGCFVNRNQKPTALSVEKITFLHPAEEGFNEQILIGMESRAAEMGCDIAIRMLPIDLAAADDVIASLKRNRSGGIIFTPFIQPDYYGLNSRILDRFENYELLYVVVDSPIASHGVIRGDFVGNDGYTAMRQVVKTLVAQGHRKIGSIRVFAGVYSSDQRIRGIFDQLTADNLPLEPELHRVIENLPLPEQGRGRARELMAQPDPPTAIICTHDVIALNVLDELHRIGKRIPEDVSLFGFDDQYYSQALQLSSVRQPLREIGRRAVEVLLTRSASRRQEFLPCELMIRESIRDNHAR